MSTRFNPPDGFKYGSNAILLPELIGYGQVTNLSYAISTNVDLRDSVEDFVLNANKYTYDSFNRKFYELVYKWTDIENSPSENFGFNIDGNHLKIVEKFYGISGENYMDRKIQTQLQANLSKMPTQVLWSNCASDLLVN